MTLSGNSVVGKQTDQGIRPLKPRRNADKENRGNPYDLRIADPLRT